MQVLAAAQAWLDAGRGAHLVTVVETWGSAPRPAGSLLAIGDDGAVIGSVSGGCVEEDLIERVRGGGAAAAGAVVLNYGGSDAEAARYRLPCGGVLRLVMEPLAEAGWLRTLLERTAGREAVARTLRLDTGEVVLTGAERSAPKLAFDGETLTTVFGPRWRMLIVGAGQLSLAVADMAPALGFEVMLCDPREEYAAALPEGAVPLVAGMPDDAVRALVPDAHTAVLALSHDPRLDDLALLEALRSAAFYVGALGSRRTQASRRERLETHFGLREAELARLHGPVGLRIGARTPAEIAVSILAEVVAVRNGAQPAAAS